VRVNDPRQRNGLIASLADALARENARLVIVDLSNRHPANLRDALRADPALAASPSPAKAGDALGVRAALAVVGLDHLIEAEADGSGRPPFAAALNVEREALPGAFPLPLIIFLTDHAMDRLALAAPDFFDWYSAIFSLRPTPYQPPAATSPEPSRALRETPNAPPLSPETRAGRLNMIEDRRAELARQAGPEARRRLAQVLREMGDLYGGLPEYDERQAAVPYYKQAVEICREIDDKAGEATALEKLGEVFYWINKYPEATRRYEAALPLYREIGDRLGEANCIKRLGDVHVRLSELPQARARYEAALPLYREIGDRLGEANAYTAFGNLELSEKNYSLAKDQFEHALVIYRQIGERIWQTYIAPRLSLVLLALEETEAAIQLLEQGAELARAVDGQPNLYSILWLLTQVRESQKDYPRALACCDELLNLSPAAADVLRRRAYILLELKNYARALADYRRLLELDANDGWAHNGVGSALEKEGNFEGAVVAYSQAALAQPDEAAFIRNRASALITLNRLDEARADCETASRLASDHEYTHGRWGDLHLARGEWAGAEARYQEAIAKTSGDTADWRFDLAMALWGLGRAEAGWAEFNAALAKAGADTRHEAISDYRRLLALHPDLPGLAEAMKRLAGAE